MLYIFGKWKWKNDLNIFDNEYIHNVDSNRKKIKNINSYNFNNCLNRNKNIKFKGIRVYYKELKDIYDKIIQTLQLIYKKK